MKGEIHVIAGGMFAGKTAELIRRLRRHQIAGHEVLAIQPSQDVGRYGTGILGDHDRGSFPAEVVSGAAEVRALAQDRNSQVVGIDEGQFLGEGIVPVAQELASEGRLVIVALLDLDFEGQPFGPATALLADAEEVTKLRAVCVVCHGDAGRSYRLVAGEEQVVVGTGEEYEARCRECWEHGRREMATEVGVAEDAPCSLWHGRAPTPGDSLYEVHVPEDWKPDREEIEAILNSPEVRDLRERLKVRPMSHRNRRRIIR